MVPELFTRLVDDAAIFPPGNLPLDRAVAEHRTHRAAEYAALVGGFVVSDVKLPDLIEVLGNAGEQPGGSESDPLGVNVVVTGGAGAIEPAVRWASRGDRLRLVALEVALRDEDDLAHNARRVIAALDSLDDMPEEVYVEPPALRGPPAHGWLAALDELAARELRLKFRTGGVTDDAFPSEADLAACVEAALDRETRFKATAGLHNACRHRDEETGFEHHGFLNVLVATGVALEGGDVTGALAERDGVKLAEQLETARSGRRWFTSFGSCSVLEPHEDLVELGLLEAGR